MAVRIRVYPRYGALGGLGGAYGGYGVGAYGVENQLTQQQLRNERQVSSLRLQYERALWAEKLKQTELTAAIKYGAAANPYMANPYMARPFGYPGFANAFVGAGALGLGTLGIGSSFDSTISSLLGPVSGIFA